MTTENVGPVIAAYRAVGMDCLAVGFAREVVTACAPAGPARARALLWAASRLGHWGISVGLEPVGATLLHPSVIERFTTVGMRDASATARRTARTNLRFLSRRVAPHLPHPPGPAALARSRAKAPYAPAEIDAFFALARAQPTEARRQRLTALLCLGLGAGLEGADFRRVTGRHVLRRSGGVVVVIDGPRNRVVPVLARYHQRLLGAAAFAGDGLICGGRLPTRKNVTANLTGHVAGGADLPHLDVGRLRASWLTHHLERLGVAPLLRAAGIVCSQRLGDLARHVPDIDETAVVALLG